MPNYPNGQITTKKKLENVFCSCGLYEPHNNNIMYLNVHLQEHRKNADHRWITQLPRTTAGSKGEVIFSNVSLCCVLVLPRLACTPTVRGPAKCRSRRVCVRQQGGGGACQWQGSQIKGRKAPFPQLNVPLGGVREGERARKRERLWTDRTPARLQIYSYQALRALPCLFLQPVKTSGAMFQSPTSSSCSSTLAMLLVAVLFLSQLLLNKYFLLVR